MLGRYFAARVHCDGPRDEFRLVGDLVEALSGNQAFGGAFCHGGIGLAQQRRKRRGHPTRRNGTEMLAVKELQAANGDVAQAVRLFEDRVEYRREIACRCVDDRQDLGGRGLARQRLVTLGFALGKLPFQIG